MHTIYGSRNMTAKRDSMTMAVLQSRCLSGVRMKDSSSERRNHVAAMTERSLESHLSMMESYRRKNSLTSAIHEDKEKQTETIEWTISKILKSRKARRLVGGTAIITFKEMEEFKKKYPCDDED